MAHFLFMHAWDINELAWEKGKFTNDNSSEYCKNTVTIGGKVYFPEEVNYFLLGVAYRNAYETISKDKYAKEKLWNIVMPYRWMYAPYETGTGSAKARLAWAEAGWDAGWDKGTPIIYPDQWSLPKCEANATIYPGTLDVHFGNNFLTYKPPKEQDLITFTAGSQPPQ
ncbi:MAG: hypothetical protein LBE12_10275 [Planctomycetaceae bacterium]|nr:hypothetical protein [Planctomycetaceae bacterium]